MFENRRNILSVFVPIVTDESYYFHIFVKVVQYNCTFISFNQRIRLFAEGKVMIDNLICQGTLMCTFYLIDTPR